LKVSGRKTGFPNRLLVATGSFGAAAGASFPKIDPAIKLKSIHMEIHFDGLGFFKKFFVNDIFESINIKDIISVIRLIQSHSQARPPSPAFI
jgi:hypothetical protein